MKTFTDFITEKQEIKPTPKFEKLLKDLGGKEQYVKTLQQYLKTRSPLAGWGIIRLSQMSDIEPQDVLKILGLNTKKWRSEIGLS